MTQGKWSGNKEAFTLGAGGFLKEEYRVCVPEFPAYCFAKEDGRLSASLTSPLPPAEYIHG